MPVGDLHGDLMKTIKVLELCKLIAPPEQGKPARWIGGDTIVVQMGDILDRGDDEIGATLLSVSVVTLFLISLFCFAPIGVF